MACSTMRAMQQVIERLKKCRVGLVLAGELLDKHSTWKIGGPADVFVFPNSPLWLSHTMRVASEFSVPVVVIGGGSNLLFDDTGVRGIVIKIDTDFAGIAIFGNRIRAGAGAWVPCLARKAGRAGLSGLEHIVGIPGTFGGLLFMNGGSQRKNIGECVRFVRVMNRQGQQFKLSHQECEFACRKSVFQKSDLVILEAELDCTSGDRSKIRREMLSILRSRNRKFPRKLPNCGSVFVSDPAIYASLGPPGKIIEDCGLKGLSVGGAEVSRQHANFIVNTGRATSEDVRMLVEKVRRKVQRQTGCWLRCEVRYVSPAGVVKPLHRFL